MDKEHNGKQRDRPGVRERLMGWLSRWGADIMLAAGALLVSTGVGWIEPPAGLIAGGAFLIVGGILLARGGDGP